MARSSRTNSDPGRPLSDLELEAYAVSYLSRFDCTTVKLRQVLARKLAKHRAEYSAEQGAVAEGERVTDRAPASIERIIARFVELGYLDDARFAQSLARGLLARGTAPRKAVERLRQRGVKGELAEQAVRDLGAPGETELAAARQLVRRKRLGWVRPEAARRERAQKDLGVLARAGFSFDVARRALAAPPDEDE